MSNSTKHFNCNDCGYYFEHMDNDESVCCPDCGSFDVELWDEDDASGLNQ